MGSLTELIMYVGVPAGVALIFSMYHCWFEPPCDGQLMTGVPSLLKSPAASSTLVWPVAPVVIRYLPFAGALASAVDAPMAATAMAATSAVSTTKCRDRTWKR